MIPGFFLLTGFSFCLAPSAFFGESVSGLHAYCEAKQMAEDDFTSLNELAYRIENGLLRLVESLERKQTAGDWIDHLIIKESNEVYGELE